MVDEDSTKIPIWPPKHARFDREGHPFSFVLMGYISAVSQRPSSLPGEAVVRVAFHEFKRDLADGQRCWLSYQPPWQPPAPRPDRVNLSAKHCSDLAMPLHGDMFILLQATTLMSGDAPVEGSDTLFLDAVELRHVRIHYRDRSSEPVAPDTAIVEPGIEQVTAVSETVLHGIAAVAGNGDLDACLVHFAGISPDGKIGRRQLRELPAVAWVANERKRKTNKDALETRLNDPTHDGIRRGPGDRRAHGD
jgi:hypothetical protein